MRNFTPRKNTLIGIDRWVVIIVVDLERVVEF